MRMLPNEFVLPATATTYCEPDVSHTDWLILVAAAPLLVMWWAGISVVVSGTMALRGARASFLKR